MKVWCIPVNFPNPEKEPEQAEAARKFIAHMKGLHGMSVQDGLVVLTFSEKEDARAAKWKLEEFSPVALHMIEGTLTEDNRKLNLNRVVSE